MQYSWIHEAVARDVGRILCTVGVYEALELIERGRDNLRWGAV